MLHCDIEEEVIEITNCKRHAHVSVTLQRNESHRNIALPMQYKVSLYMQTYFND